MNNGSSSHYRDTTVAGISWSVIAQLGKQAIQFLIGVILARLLSPEIFGLIGMITVFVGFANIFMDLGFGSALIQRQDVDQRHYSSVFWLNLLAGFGLTLLFISLAPLVARFYNQPILISLTMVSSVNFLIGSLGVVQSSILKKRLDFKRLAYVDILSVTFSGVVGIILALSDFGVWSLVWQSILATSLKVIVLWIVSDWTPTFLFKRKELSELLPFSLNLLGFTSVNYWLRNGDNLLVGRFLGDSALGIYSKSYSIMLLPLSMVSKTIGRVMFPAFSLIQENKQRVAKIYLQITRTIALVTFPMMIGLAVVVEDFVYFVFGEQWAGMIPILRIFSLIGLLQSVGTLNGNLYLSQGRSDLQFKVGTVLGVLGIGSIALGLRWGITGVAYTYSLYFLLAIYPSIAIAISLVDLKFNTLIKNLSGVSICSAAMGLAVWLVGLLVPEAWPQGISLAIQVSTGILIYWGLLQIFRIQAYQDVLDLAHEYWQKFNRRSGDLR